jgi:hypothetical protein
MQKKHVHTDDKKRQFIKVEDVWTQEDLKRAQNMLETRDFGDLETTLYEVVLRRLRNEGHDVKKRRFTDPENVIYLTNN